MNQSDLASNLGVDKTAVSQWVKGKSAPRGSRLDDVAAELGVSVSDLFKEAS